MTTDPSYLGLVVEFCAGGDLRSAIDAPDYAERVDEPRRRRWLSDVALGMAYLYDMGVEHRDLKTLNVLLDGPRDRCKVTDFGLSKSEELNTALTMATQQAGAAKGTPAYMAPELLESNTFTEKTDVYAFAIVIWEVLTGEFPWQGLNPMQIGMQVMVKKARPPVPANAPQDLVALLQRCWAHDAARRPTFEAIKSWLADASHPMPLSPSQTSLGPLEEVEDVSQAISQAMPQQPTMQQPMQQPMMQLPQHEVMSVLVPNGAMPGMMLQVRTPCGRTLNVTIPPGATPGSQFQAQY